MKRILAFMASGIIPTFIPICALLTLPVCFAQRYIPQDIQKSFAYGIQFFKLVLNPTLEARPQVARIEAESIPVVESEVTSMAFANEVECDEMQMDEELVEPAIMAKLNKGHFIPASKNFTVRVDLNKEMLNAQSEMKHLEILRDLKIAVPVENFEIAVERALKRVEAHAQSMELRKNPQKALRIAMRKKVQLPA
ncbi:MAG TPA: hypothetical protein VLH08_16855 [Acidobacteriota bacterium]|nr:hypothetical protein [Acidobacteriota bacterium]